MNPTLNNNKAKTKVGQKISATNPIYFQEMLLKHMNLVQIIIAKMKHKLPSNTDFEELHSSGIMGLISAIEKFDSSLGYQFSTYASIRIRGAILDEIRSIDSMSRPARKRLRTIRKVVASLEQELGRSPSDQEICAKMNISLEEFLKINSKAQPHTFIFLDAENPHSENNSHEIMPDEKQKIGSEVAERNELTKIAISKIEHLPQKQKQVLQLYFFENMKLLQIAKILGISEARVSQIRTQALSSLRAEIDKAPC